MNAKNVFPLLVGLLLFQGFTAMGQGSDLYGSGLKVKLNDDGSKYLRFITWHQVWIRYNRSNEGSLKNEIPTRETYDFGLRRSRMLILAQISPRFLILTHFGINNQNAGSGGVNGGDGKKPQLFIHDAWTEYKVYKEYLSLGAGLHYWNGISRMTSASTLNFLAYDATIFNWPTIDASDQFARYLGVYAKGQIGPLDYRISVNDPFLTNTSKVISAGRAEYSPRNNSKIYQGYFSFNIFEKENNTLPYYVGSYLGSKKVLNLGAGFMYNKDAMWSKPSTNDTSYHDMRLFGADLFADIPLNKETKSALTVYGVYYNYYMGPKYVRYVGIMNPNNAGGALRGNAVPLIGTGNIYYAQVGYVTGKTLIPKLRLQPYAAFTYATFHGVRNSQDKMVPVKMLDLGTNFLLEGHHAKVTLNYRLRPDFYNVDNVRYRSELTLQTMIYL